MTMRTETIAISSSSASATESSRDNIVQHIISSEPSPIIFELIEVTTVYSTSSYDLLSPSFGSDGGMGSEIVSLASGSTSDASYIHSSKANGNASWDMPKYFSSDFPTEDSMGEETTTWKSTILNRKDIRSSREKSLSELKALFNIEICPCCQADILQSLELFSVRPSL